jgi:hypothetical protein
MLELSSFEENQMWQLSFSDNLKVFVRIEPCDMRKGSKVLHGANKRSKPADVQFYNGRGLTLTAFLPVDSLMFA